MANYTVGSLPQINAAACSGWLPQDISLYNALPVWMIDQADRATSAVIGAPLRFAQHIRKPAGCFPETIMLLRRMTG